MIPLTCKRIGWACLPFVLLAMSPSIGRSSEPSPHSSGLEVSDKVSTGSTPTTQAAFDSLKDSGVKTIISVDAARPDAAAASRSGLRYIHLPIGYDGITDQRALQLAKAVRDSPGKVYVHCHHGKHRGPAAAAIACLTTGMIDSQQAVRVLRRAGTSELYTGLYQAIETAGRVPLKSLDAFQYPFHAYEPVSSLANRMLALDLAWENLQQSDANRFPAAKTLVVQHFQELIRANESSSDFAPDDHEAAMEILRDGSELSSRMQFGDDPSLQAVQQNCVHCHQRFRN